MTDPKVTNVDAEPTVTAAARMTAYAQELGVLWDEVGAQVQGLHDVRPWSDDAVGREFEVSYLPTAGAVTEAASALMVRLTDSGTNVGLAALDAQSADQDSAATLDGSGYADPA